MFPTILNQSASLVSVNCQVTADPPADLCWLYGDHTPVSKDNQDVGLSLSHLSFLLLLSLLFSLVLYSQRVYSSEGILYIVNPLTEDSGQYICRANNSAGINQVSITLFLGQDASGDGSELSAHIHPHQHTVILLVFPVYSHSHKTRQS